MLETLDEYIESNDLHRLTDELELIARIGGPSSQYYNVCYSIAKVMLLGESEKRRCVILYGTSGSGKSKIARMMTNIFDSHYKMETKGMYDERITREEAHK